MRIRCCWYADCRGVAEEEALYILLQHLFSLKYRRVEWYMDANDSMRKLAERSGFRLAAPYVYSPVSMIALL
jgi:hypothetical protein